MLNAPKAPPSSKQDIRTLRERRRWLLILLAGSVAVGATFIAPTPKKAMPPPPKDIAPVAALKPPERPAELPERQTLGRAGVDPFAPRSWAPPLRPRLEREEPPRLEREDPPPQASAPPVPYRLAGTVRYGGTLKVVLAVGDRIHEAKVGELLDGLYRVQAVTSDTVTVVYMPLGVEQHVTYAASESIQAAGPQPSPPDLPRQAMVEHQPPLLAHQAPRAVSSSFPPGSPLATR